MAQEISWLKDWYKKQEQLDRLVSTYKNNEMMKSKTGDKNVRK